MSRRGFTQLSTCVRATGLTTPTRPIKGLGWVDWRHQNQAKRERDCIWVYTLRQDGGSRLQLLLFHYSRKIKEGFKKKVRSEYQRRRGKKNFIRFWLGAWRQRRRNLGDVMTSASQTADDGTRNERSDTTKEKMATTHIPTLPCLRNQFLPFI